MQWRSLRLLAIPAVVALGTALAVACSDGVTAASDQAQIAPDKVMSIKGKKGGGPVYTDNAADGSCPANSTKKAANSNTAAFDANLDGYICQY
jgi:hypothetical protein